jgi:hypothetical protein
LEIGWHYFREPSGQLTSPGRPTASSPVQTWKSAGTNSGTNSEQFRAPIPKSAGTNSAEIGWHQFQQKSAGTNSGWHQFQLRAICVTRRNDEAHSPSPVECGIDGKRGIFQRRPRRRAWR